MEEKVRAVEAVFEKLDQEITSFQRWSGLHCQWGCGKCCFKPDIEASVIEFLPFAYAAFHQGTANDLLERLSSNESSLCIILNPTQHGAGLCSQYTYRGLICRLFGFSARKNKYGTRELVTCQIIKTEQSQAYQEAGENVAKETKDIPVMSNFYMQLHAIDYDLAREFLPINQAIKRAIEIILHYYAYRS